MKLSPAIQSFRKDFAAHLNVPQENVFLYWKGRVALFELLKAMNVTAGDEVILPAFTCVVVPNAILYLGAKPIYVDIDPLTFNMDVGKLEEKVSSRTKIIIAQNTFGLAPDIDSIVQIASRNNIKVIEDCTHGFGGTYKGKQNGTIADASFFSSQWNKPFSTGIGGMAVVRDKGIIDKLQEVEKNIPSPTTKDELVLSSLLFARKNLMNSFTYWNALKLYRYLSKKNILIGSSGGGELETIDMPTNYRLGFSDVQAKEGNKELKRVDEYISHRRKIASAYDEVLASIGLRKVFQPDYAEHTFLKYPLLVKNRESFLQLAEKNKIELGEWFLSPIHPVENNFELWGYKYGSNPVAEKISARIINLPTGININDAYLERIKKFLLSNREELLKD